MLHIYRQNKNEPASFANFCLLTTAQARKVDVAEGIETHQEEE